MQCYGVDTSDGLAVSQRQAPLSDLKEIRRPTPGVG